MAGKLRHFLNRDGRYYARLIVPKHLRSYLGNKSDLRIPLGGDYRVAVRQHASAVASLQQQIAVAEKQFNSASGTMTPPRYPMTRNEMAVSRYRETLGLDEALREINSYWPNLGVDDLYVRQLRDVIAGRGSVEEIEATVGEIITSFRERGNTDAVTGSQEWRSLARVLAGAELEAIRGIAARDDGDQIPVPAIPALANVSEAKRDPLPLKNLFNAYFAELMKSHGKGREAKKRWKSTFDDLRKFLKHDDARRITRADVIAFKDHKLNTLAPSTVRDTIVAALKAIFGWAVDNGQLESNPAERVKVRVSKKPRTREKGFTDSEAKTILDHCIRYQPRQTGNLRTTEARETAAAKKWAPWLCAFTGARIVEITQLRKVDVHADGEIPFIRITPDAGSVKDGTFRDVPLHPRLIELGFLDFVNESSDGALFYLHHPKNDPTRSARVVAGRVSQWLQGTGHIPEGVSPNHGWRHRFKTMSMEAGIDSRIADAIQGHAPRTAGEGYGDVTLLTKKNAIAKMHIPA